MYWHSYSPRCRGVGSEPRNDALFDTNVGFNFIDCNGAATEKIRSAAVAGKRVVLHSPTYRPPAEIRPAQALDFMDYILLNRPIIFFPYDLEHYLLERGVQHDYNAITSGPKCLTQAEAQQALREIVVRGFLVQLPRDGKAGLL